MPIKAILSLLLAVLLALPATGFAAAQEAEMLPCEGDQVTGTVVAVDDATGTVTVDTGDGLCTVDVDDDDSRYAHPMVALLSAYFGSTFDTTGLTDALDTVEGCALQDPETEAWTWVACGTEGAVQVVVTADNQDGAFSATADGEEIDVAVDDPLTAQGLSDALAEMHVDWELNGDGGLSQVGSQIASYHEDGLGFGVLTKLFAMAAESREACADADPIDGGMLGEVSADGLSLEVTAVTETCGVAVDDLVTAFRSGTGMGQLFKEYGKPSILGIGHVRKAQRDAAESTPESLTDEETATTLESQAGNGNGKGIGATGPGNGKGAGGNGQGNGKGGGNGHGKGKP